MVRVASGLMSCTNQVCPWDEYYPPWPLDGAARLPWLRLQGHAQTKAFQGMSTDHLSHLAALYVTPKWLQTLPGPKMGLAGSHGWGYWFMHQLKLKL